MWPGKSLLRCSHLCKDLKEMRSKPAAILGNSILCSSDYCLISFVSFQFLFLLPILNIFVLLVVFAFCPSVWSKVVPSSSLNLGSKHFWVPVCWIDCVSTWTTYFLIFTSTPFNRFPSRFLSSLFIYSYVPLFLFPGLSFGTDLIMWLFFLIMTTYHS